MSKDLINICLIGAGRAGLIHAYNFKTQVANANITAVADPNEEASVKVCKDLGIRKYYPDYRDCLKDEKIDAVIVVTPTVYHRDIVIAAARAGKHVLCEKPMAMDENECDDMITSAEENHIKLQIGFMRRFDKAYIQAKECVENGEIGDVVLVKSNTRGPSIPQKWMYDIEKSNGPLAEVNSHDIDTLRWFTGSEFKSVYAIGGNYRSPEAKKDYPDFYDNVILSALFDNGMQGAIDGSQGVAYGYDARVEILGTRGCIFLGQVDGERIVICNNKKGMIKPTMNSWRKLFKEAYIEEDRSFIKCILNDEQPIISGYDGKMAVKVVKAGNLSIKEKRVVELV